MRLIFFFICFLFFSRANSQVLRSEGALMDVSSTAVVITGGVTLNNGSAVNNSGTIYVKGNWTNNAVSSMGSVPGVVDFNGTSLQQIGGASVTEFDFMRISNSAGVQLQQNQKVLRTLIFNSGKITTGPYEVYIPAIPANPVVGAGINSYVNGNLRVGAGPAGSSYKFEIGSNTYAPAEAELFGLQNQGSVLAFTLQGPAAQEDIPFQNASAISSAERIQQHWVFDFTGITPSSFNTEFDFSNTNYSGNPLDYQVRRYNSATGWTSETTLTAPTTVSATGVAADGLFVAGKLVSSSLPEFSTETISIFPNPSAGSFTVYTQGAANSGQRLIICDIAGRQVFATSELNQGSSFTISADAAKLQAGLYGVSLLEGNIRKGFKALIIYK